MDPFGYNQRNTLSNSRVYINPNFNRNAPQKSTPVSNNVMYLNPSFSNQISSQNKAVINSTSRNDTVRPKIHVNPNFFKQTQNVPLSIPNYSNANLAYSNTNSVYCNPNVNTNSVFSNSNTVYCNSNASSNLVYSNSNVNSNLVYSYSNANSNLVYSNSNANSNLVYSNSNVNSNLVYPNSSVNSNSVDTSSHILGPNNQLSHPQKTENEIHTNTQTSVSKSRYCLVRKIENNVKISNTKVTNTVKVNKYKIVSLNTVKMNIVTDKLAINKVAGVTVNRNMLKTKYKIRSKPTINVQHSRFRYIKRNSASILNLSKTNAIRRTSLVLNKSLLKTNIQPLKKIPKGPLKKNNIPCPLYKKYGQCLRLSRGRCDFLHDKKHVTICRKFMKGICHDDRCLLSHDLTDKKMPTCHFYLQGMCTKENCPYLHVKLNEKAKICQDFVKGYCERGDKCGHRHVDITKSSKTASTRQNPKLNKRLCTEKGKNKRKNSLDNRSKANASLVQPAKQNDEDGRYFKDSAVEQPDEQCSLIKPSRCKLGTLPSFIQL